MTSTGEIAVVTSALSTEAEKWRQLAKEMDVIGSSVAGLRLEKAAFFAGFDISAPTVLPPRYDNLRNFMEKLIHQASVEFNEIAAALDRARRLYEAGDIKAAQNNTKAIYGS